MKAGPLSKTRALDDFFARIQSRKEALQNEGVPSSLSQLVDPFELESVYKTIELQKTQIETALQKMGPDVSLRIEKNLKTGLPRRTINIIKDIDGNICLFLETKSKKAGGRKDKWTTPFWRGGAKKKGKPCWRIDTPNPEEWVNMVTKADQKEKLEREQNEAHLSQSFVKGRAEQPAGNTLPINYSLVGAQFQKNGMFQQSLYSPRALCSLAHLLYPPSDLTREERIIIDNIELTPEDKDRIAKSLLQALKLMHDAGIVHQDIKPSNVLIYKDPQGKYYCKLTDFGNSTPSIRPTYSAMSTVGYESPEISLAYSDYRTVNYDYFHSEDYESYGNKVRKQLINQGRNDYDETYKDSIKNQRIFAWPHTSNDIWATGCLLFELYKGRQLNTLKDQWSFNSLLEGLLDPNRDTRYTVDQALKELSPTLDVPSPEIIVQSPAPYVSAQNTVPQEIPIPTNQLPEIKERVVATQPDIHRPVHTLSEKEENEKLAEQPSQGLPAKKQPPPPPPIVQAPVPVPPEAGSAPERRALDEFFARIRSRESALKIEGVPSSLGQLIHSLELESVYKAIELHKAEIETALQQVGPNASLRIEKDLNTGLPRRTINITKDLDGTICLFLETKSKKKYGRKNKYETPLWGGASKKGKPCWRIDTPIPEEWVNMVVTTRVDQKEKLDKKQKEAHLSQSLVRGLGGGPGGVTLPLNYSLVGAQFQKGGMLKQSLYSPRALCSLGNLLFPASNLTTEERAIIDGIKLTSKDKDRIAKSLLLAVKLMHDAGKVHQDIKPENILIYKDSKGNYYCKLTDFGISTPLINPTEDALATHDYESPEISLTYSNPQSALHGSFHRPTYNSYASEVRMQLVEEGNAEYDWQNPASEKNQKDFRLPHPSNDMWAIGCVLFYLYNGDQLSTIKDQRYFNKLMKGLLDPNRNTRYTVEQALKELPTKLDVPFPEILVQAKAPLDQNPVPKKTPIAPNQPPDIKEKAVIPQPDIRQSVQAINEKEQFRQPPVTIKPPPPPPPLVSTEQEKRKEMSPKNRKK